ncbi:Lsr2 family DNA-binding protein [Streptomyces anthocyanicus]|uniref:Lsr2 family DNA-binding protein n=1 Tax=Streptomyces anthocyanicus TaxID=68174 RepID=UPI0038008963
MPVRRGRHEGAARRLGGLTREERKLLPVLPSDKAQAISVLQDVLDAADTAEEEAQAAPSMPVDDPPAEATPSTPEPGADEPPGLGVRPLSTGGNYTPQERAAYERRCVELLRAGATYAEITAELGITAPVIVRVRRQAGLPHSGRTGGQPARKKADVLAENTEPYSDGHTRWTGPMSGRMPTLYAEQRRFNARHFAFEQHHGRRPVGYVRSNCGEQACFTGAHLTDDLMRSPHPPSERTSPVATTPPTTEVASTSQILAWAEDHPDPDVQAQGARIEASLVGLRQRYVADQELTRITTRREQLEKELAALAAREAELAPLKKKRKTGAYVRDYDTRTVRAWAAEQSIDCPPKGQIPKRVLDAWRAAHPKTDGGTR